VVAVTAVLATVWRQYAVLLETRPVITKSITAAIIAVVGDYFAQVRQAAWAAVRARAGRVEGAAC
jgi:hypothetical protein